MRTDSKENLLPEKPATSALTSGASEHRAVPAGKSQAETSLSRLAELAEQLDAKQVASDARSVTERVSEGRFYVACIGQFKRGKSSVLNALVGDSILPTGVVPVTAVPTIIRYGRAVQPLACALKPASGRIFLLRPLMNMSLKRRTPRTPSMLLRWKSLCRGYL